MCEELEQQSVWPSTCFEGVIEEEPAQRWFKTAPRQSGSTRVVLHWPRLGCGWPVCCWMEPGGRWAHGHCCRVENRCGSSCYPGPGDSGMSTSLSCLSGSRIYSLNQLIFIKAKETQALHIFACLGQSYNVHCGGHKPQAPTGHLPRGWFNAF